MSSPRHCLAITAFVALAACASSRAEPFTNGALKPNDRVAFCGDSITEQKNYTAILEGYLLVCQPAPKLDCAQFGWGGETTWGFKTRMATDVLWFKPDVATVCYGMNDGGYGPVDLKRLANYRDSTLDIIHQLKAAGTRHIVIVGPGVADPDAYHGGKGGVEYNKTLAAFNAAAGEVAKSEDVSFADLHTIMAGAMDKYKAMFPGRSIAGNDGIHPDNLGHTVMAYAILKALGCNGDVGTITFTLSSGQAQATDGHKILSSKDGVIEIESSKYPYPILHSKDPNAMGVALDLVPFNQDLNRFRLIVPDAAPDAQYSITWGKSTITVAGADLAAGINLPDRFPTSPFSEAFSRVDGAIHGQQDFETPMMKQMIHGQDEWIRLAPDSADTWRQLATSSQKLDSLLRQRTAAAVIPVKHTLKIALIK